jgi:periplasmic protein TonB
MPFYTAFLTALILHILGLTVLSLCWEAWRGVVPLQPSPPVLIAIAPVPEPVPVLEPPPEPVPLPEPVSPPLADPLPEPIPATPPPVPPTPEEPVPPKRVEPRRKPTPTPRIAQGTPAKPPPVRERAARPASPEPAPRSPGHAGDGSAEPLAAAPSPETSQRPSSDGGRADAGHLFARGDMPVAPGGGSGGDTAPGDAGTDGDGAGRQPGSTRSGTGGVPGPGRGSGGPGSGGSGGERGSVRPIGGYQVKLRYPELARRQGIEGTVLLKMRITAQGRVEDVQVERSAGHPDLDQAATEAVRRWRFEPARRGGEPVAVWVVIPVEFKLQ